MARTKAQNAATYQRRVALARERGFTSYADQRKQFAYAVQSESWEYGQASYVEQYGIPRASNPDDVPLVRLFYQAFKLAPNDYSVRGAKAQWFVDVEGIMSYDQWVEHYPTGKR